MDKGRRGFLKLVAGMAAAIPLSKFAVPESAASTPKGFPILRSVRVLSPDAKLVLASMSPVVIHEPAKVSFDRLPVAFNGMDGILSASGSIVTVFEGIKPGYHMAIEGSIPAVAVDPESAEAFEDTNIAKLLDGHCNCCEFPLVRVVRTEKVSKDTWRIHWKNQGVFRFGIEKE